MPEILTSRSSSAGKLCRSADLSDKMLQPFRDRRRDFLAQIAGRHYGSNDPGSARQPLNLLFGLAATLEPILSMRRIRTSVKSASIEGRPTAEKLRVALNYVCRKMRIDHALREAVRNSLTDMGIVKTSRVGQGNKPFAFTVEAISLDDYVIDRRSKIRKPGSYSYEGHRFRMGYQEAMDSDLFRGKHDLLEQLRARQELNAVKANTIATGGGSLGEDEFDPQIELVEMWLPNEGMCVWLPGDLQGATDYLREFEWYGHDSGPIDVWGYHWINDNPMPVPIMAAIYDLYLLQNVLANKTARQAINQKDIALVDAPTPEIADAVRKAQDGEYVMAKDIKGAVLSLGGGNVKGYEAIAWFNDWFQKQAGNPDVVGGLEANSATLGQDQMKLQQSSIRVKDMADSVMEAASSVVTKLAWYVWNDQSLKLRLVQRFDAGAELPVQWPPASGVVGQFDDFDLEVEAYAAGLDSPEARYRRVLEWATQIAMPAAQIGAAQGSRLNVDVLTNITGRDLDIPEIDELWEESLPVSVPGELGGASQPGQPANPAMRQTQGRTPGSVVNDMAVASMGGGQ